MDWVDIERGRGQRDRQANAPIPEQLSMLTPEQMELLKRWARMEAARRGRPALLKDVGAASIELAETLCDRLLRDGWIIRRERLTGGSWRWDSIEWRDLAHLQSLLGLTSRGQRAEQRSSQVERAKIWLQARRDDPSTSSLDPDLLDEFTHALSHLESERSMRVDQLSLRLSLMQCIATWRDAGLQGNRRDFALYARGSTKAVAEADWRWLESEFDLDRLRIARFAQVVWLAGDMTLRWGEQATNLAPLHFAGLPLTDLARAEAILTPTRWWLIENRTSFERQAAERAAGTALVWMPGRPSSGWLAAVRRLLERAPAPAWISADADPAGIDIACGVGALWASRGLAWEPHRMGVAEWASTAQHWPLNEHDRRLLGVLLARSDLPPELRGLCEQIQKAGRKAEQEAWL
jgi:hypothetical protein